MNETTERMLYRMKCKHYVEGSELCALHSQNGNWHFMMKCDGNCRRMKNYDKKIKQNETKEFEINSIIVNGVKYDIVDNGEINCKNCDLANDYGANEIWDNCPMCEHCCSLLGMTKIFKKSN